jgi:predicted transcriptional regulator
MKRHLGQIVEDVIRRKELNLTNLATKMNISRGNLYKWFSCEHLRLDVIYGIGHAIDHDFSTEFPDLVAQIPVKRQRGAEPLNSEIYYKDKYVDLLEKYRLILERRKSLAIENTVPVN